MHETRSVQEFYNRNLGDIVKLLKWKRVYDASDQHDIIQDFFVALIRTKSLLKWNPKKSSFNTYITKLLLWIIRKHQRRSDIPIQNQSNDFISLKIEDFRGYIQRHASDASSMLSLLDKRLNDQILSVYDYRDHYPEFIALQKAYAADSTYAA